MGRNYQTNIHVFMIPENQKELATYFVSKLGELVGKTYRKAFTLELSHEQAKNVMLESFKIMGKLSLPKDSE